MAIRHVSGVVLLTCMVGCGGSDGKETVTGPGRNPGGGTANAVDVRDNNFSPAEVVVAPGTTVTWTWRGYTSHNVVFDDGTSSATQSTGTFSRVFPAAGTFPYHCTVHGAGMSGDVVVR